MYSRTPSAPGRRLPKPTPSLHKNATRSQRFGEARPPGSSGYISDTFPLTRELAAAAAPCFDTADRLAVHTAMNLGAQQHAIDDIICAVLREDHPIPAVLLDRLWEWLAVSPHR